MRFSIHSFNEAGFDLVALTDSLTGTTVTVIPAHGALLHSFKVKKGNNELNLIDSYKDLADMQLDLTNSFKNVKLSPYACRIKDAKYTFNGNDYTLQQTVAPGRAIHGLLYNAPFKVTATAADDSSAVLTLEYTYQQEDAGYPFPYHCKAAYTLLPGNELEVATTITNQGTATMPLMDGWHPYFTTGTSVDELELTFASKEIVEFDATLIPTGNVLPYTEFAKGKKLAGIELDNSFVLDFVRPQPLATLFDPVKDIRISFFPGENYPILQVYIPPHRRSIAIENLSGAPDAFNNGLGLVKLDAGEEKVFSTRIKVD
ncbi:aldose 1-epimerase [Chitinophaga sp. Cy-1792]|uniref:aldose 1-epimerase n=1 Tax=Chitinophaga sp. Cy-1792 TaxID=2608339 RepID=UPI001422BCAA|nr:aldose 1-epimerase [Chitinophaga sp. Cy-1792]NIG57274.1 aldose 1-epimerase [Chitinophaga sp. Cy-1792]